MSSVNDGTMHRNYFNCKYSEELHGNLVDMKNQIEASHEQLIKSIANGPDLSTHAHKLTDGNQARHKLYEVLLNFAIESLAAVQEKTCNAGRPDSDALKLLTYSSIEAEGSSLGTLVPKGYEPPTLSINAIESCRCVNFKCPKCIQDEQARATEPGARWDNPSAEHTGVGPPSSEDSQSMLDLRLSLLMMDVPAPWDDLPPSPQPSYASSLSSLNLRGPGDEFRHQVLLLPPKVHVRGPVFDAHFHSTGSFLCSWAGKSESRDLWFQSSKTMQWVKVSKGQFFKMCSSYRGTEAFTVSGPGPGGDNWVKKFDLKTGTPLQIGSQGYFQVRGGKRLCDISMSYRGRLAVSDWAALRVTVHEPSGDLVCELKGEKLEGCWPGRLCWFNEGEEKLLVNVWRREEDINIRRIHCFLIPAGDLVWKSEEFIGWVGPIYSNADRIYFVSGSLPNCSIKVLSGESGEKIEEVRWEEESEPHRVMDVDGQVTVVCWKLTK